MGNLPSVTVTETPVDIVAHLSLSPGDEIVIQNRSYPDIFLCEGIASDSGGPNVLSGRPVYMAASYTIADPTVPIWAWLRVPSQEPGAVTVTRG